MMVFALIICLGACNKEQPGYFLAISRDVPTNRQVAFSRHHEAGFREYQLGSDLGRICTW